jgi:rubredoxin
MFPRGACSRALPLPFSQPPGFLPSFTMNAVLQTDATPLRKFMCVVCGWIYDEAQGWPDDGIAPGTRWEDIAETWTCPDCGVTKSDFEMMQV